MGSEQGLRFHVLGAVEGWAGDARLRLGGVIQERILVTLLLEYGRLVPVARLVEAAWDELPPLSAEHQVRKAISDLRRRIPGGAGVIVTDGPGYRAESAEFGLDLSEFARGLRLAREAVAEERRSDAVVALREALALWRGPVMVGRGGRVIEAAAIVWEERRLAASEQCFELRLALGEAGELVGDLRALVSQHPLREAPRGHLMLALYRAGRGVEALEEYGAVRALLAEELGIDPGARLAGLHEAILREDPDLAPPHRPASAGPDGSPGPAQGIRALPYDPPDFTGRNEELELLLDHVRRPGGEGTHVIAIDGMGGAGKTALAVHAAHRLAPHYPDGQLHIDLRGFTPGESPFRPGAALESLLRALGMPHQPLPGSAEERARVWRAALARKRVLILLDNAADTAQVLPLLPASPGCLVLVTSRARLVDLDGAEWFSIGMLVPEDSTALLAEMLGAERAAAEPEAVAELAELCGRLPLALRIVAARLRNRPRWTVRHLVERLSHETRRLDELSVGQRSVTAALELSYQALGARQRAVFCLLGQHPGVEIDVWSAAALAGTSAREAEDVLEHLLDVHLLQQHTETLYSFHDLVRSFARSLWAGTADGDEADGVVARRLLPYYLGATEAACAALFPDRLRIETGFPVPDAGLPSFPTPEDALAWFDREHHAIQLALNREGDAADQRCVLHLSRNLAFYFYTRSRVEEQATQGVAAVRAARRLGEPRLLSLSLNNLAVSHWRLGHFPEGVEAASEALEISRRSGDRQHEAISVGRLGLLHSALGHIAEALSFLEQAVVLRRESGDEVGAAESWTNLSTVYRWLGRFPEAAGAVERAVRINQRIGSYDNEKMALIELAATRLGTGDVRQALDILEQALALGDETRRSENHALALAFMAEARQLLGERENALHDADRALELVGRSGARLRSSEVENIVGRVHRGSGDPARALQLHKSAFERSTVLGYRVETACALVGLARAAEDVGDHQEAAEYFRQAHGLFEAMGLAASHRSWA
ncbi:AfsR/SARP family transcriptional regulator [Streptomyces gobiensis]|uniref:AfsR/SARP family transcriptional regulator n=1 Tax=Streptomyces gobiensis TaxID=2875706 RepID=UPI001E61FA00|nr:BTAD domain-containing putative transcriptional regulator [Streptomyces gobiensis]UGY92403.1 tetratricopeptide repeat protein [Streptomyces gobiensis]